MEKRLLIAFLLSFLVLTIWGALNPAPSRKTDQGTNSQLYEIKEDIENLPLVGVKGAPISTHKEVKESIHLLENEKIRAEFSNLGGSLKKVTIKEYDVSLPVTDIISVSGLDSANFFLDIASQNRVVYTYENKESKIIKEYSLAPDDYIVQSRTIFQNTSNMSKLKDISIEPFRLDISKLDISSNIGRDKTLFEYFIASDGIVIRKGNAFQFSEKDRKEKVAPVDWVGFRDRYFAIIIKPDYASDLFRVNPVGKCLNSGTDGEKQNTGSLFDSKDLCESANGNHKWTYDLAVKLENNQVSLPINGRLEYSQLIFFGPQRLRLLKSYEAGFEEAMRFSNFGLLDVIAKGIYMFLHGLHKIMPNWGVCIILISLIIYGAMYPLTMKGMSSMRRMQVLQPQIKKIQDQHKSNPQKMNQEVMALYKEHKVNPLGGCLPLLLQMPIFIGLYQVLWRSVSFKGAGFMWIKDLSEPDRLFIFPFSLPFLGNELNILPVIMIIVMVFQQKISAKNMVAGDAAQAAQQKMMTTVFPLFLGFIFYKFASGLTLYFTIFYLLSTFTQWKMAKMIKVV